MLTLHCIQWVTLLLLFVFHLERRVIPKKFLCVILNARMQIMQTICRFNGDNGAELKFNLSFSFWKIEGGRVIAASKSKRKTLFAKTWCKWSLSSYYVVAQRHLQGVKASDTYKMLFILSLSILESDIRSTQYSLLQYVGLSVRKLKIWMRVETAVEAFWIFSRP